ncbi:hypothetical protein QTO30_05310 [Yoonia sp. GPGPB17]|uniref:hypothetical protein n=1 Tax=Yoonia sp. GPGPB17 TaxID=3026147 RepID=UPI0030C4EBC4
MLRWLMIAILAAQSAGADSVSQFTQATHLAFDRLPDVRRVDQIAGHCGADETVNQTVAYCTTRNQIFLASDAIDADNNGDASQAPKEHDFNCIQLCADGSASDGHLCGRGHGANRPGGGNNGVHGRNCHPEMRFCNPRPDMFVCGQLEWGVPCCDG